MKTNYVFLIAFTAFTFFCSQVTKASVSGPDSLPKIDNSQSMLAVSSSHHGGHGGGGDKNFSAGGQLSYSAYLGDAPFHMIGLGINGEYFAGKYAFRFLFNYNFSYTTPTAISVISQSNYTPPYYMGSTLDSTVTATDVVGLMTLGFDVKKVFGSRDYSDGGFYGFAGLG
ncbi:MAG TPA: hypothetical protein VNY36_09065, partial [Bacteroidia bacterium]|nr:hypothetical protein [Bacteroidia bacterium]